MRTEQLGANTSCFAGATMAEAIGRIRDLGFRGLTLLAYAGARSRTGYLAGFWFHDMDDSQRRWLKSLVDGFEKLSIHAPFADLPLFSYDPRLEQLSLERVRESIDAAAYLGAQVVALHANPQPNFAVQDYWSHMVETFRALGVYAQQRGVALGVETGYPDDVELFADLVEAIGHPAVGATLDVGHIVRYVDRDLRGTPQGVQALNDRLVDLASQLGPTIVQCHVHDVRAADWRDHQMVGSGLIDFPRLLSELQAIGYEGMLEVEVELSAPEQVSGVSESKRRLERWIRQIARPLPAARRAAV